MRVICIKIKTCQHYWINSSRTRHMVLLLKFIILSNDISRRLLKFPPWFFMYFYFYKKHKLKNARTLFCATINVEVHFPYLKHVFPQKHVAYFHRKLQKGLINYLFLLKSMFSVRNKVSTKRRGFKTLPRSRLRELINVSFVL